METNDNLLLEENKNKIPKKKYYVQKEISKLLFFYFCIIFLQISEDNKKFLNIIINVNKNISENKIEKANNLKIAVCTMGKRENLYVKEYVDYYVKLGIDHLFIYDDNDQNTERISDEVEPKYETYVTVYENIKDTIKDQSTAFTDCYYKNIDKYDWFLMVDMDEFLYIVNNSLKDYLVSKDFDKCDFIKFNWVNANDNGLLHYDNRSLFERFKGPYIKDEFIKTIIRGNISDLKYWVHSPYISPKRNISCNSIGKQIISKKVNIESVSPINVEKAFIIHFRYKSTEEFINKYKRGYSNWLGDRTESFLKSNIGEYFRQSELTLEKIEYIEKELDLYLFSFRMKYYLSKIIYFG